MKHPLDPEDLSDEFPRRKKHYIQCSDRTCGALDCPNCFPGTYREAFCPDDIEETEKQKDSFMKPHQQRVIDEKRELDDKRKKLDTFIGSEKFKAIPLEERWRLTRQADHMADYSDVLSERIRAFEK